MIDISVYLNRITSQHKIKPKYMSFLTARLQPFIDLVECLETFDAAFNIDVAVGKQLDIIGQYVGVERFLNFQPQYAPVLLPDSYYRMLLKARISLNNWDGTASGIKRIWGNIFPDYTIDVVDNQNMTMSVLISGLQSIFESEIINHGYVTPKPMGVLVDYTFICRIALDTTLYMASFTYNRFLHRGLPSPKPPTEVTVTPGQLYASGKTILNIIDNTMQNKPPPANISPSIIGECVIGGVFINKSVFMSIEGDSTASVFDSFDRKIYKEN